MQTEKFYNKIRENLDNPDFTPEWDKSEVWQRIEQKNKQKVPLFWLRVAAAGVIMVSLFGIYLLADDKNMSITNSHTKQPVVSESTQQVVFPETIKPIKERPEYITPVLSERVGRIINHKQLVKPANEIAQEAVVGSEIVNEEFDNIVTTEEGVQEFSYNNVTSRNEPALVRPVIFDAPIIFRPNKTTEQSTGVAPVKRERVAILEIPEDQEDYVISPKEKKKGRHTRLAKQAEKIPVATDPNKPNKIWAFVKQSFKNETIPADSTIK